MYQKDEELIRYEVEVYGIIQGVGFRPFIYKIAELCNLKGFVQNNGSCVLIDLEGMKSGIKAFIKKMLSEAPPLAKIEKIKMNKRGIKHWEDFKIKKSEAENLGLRFVPRDAALCKSCEQELMDPGSRWFGYAFTNCTDCGPRYSIMKQLPYDRSSTTMDCFFMCPQCKAEYEQPRGRRFHAQPISCPHCGPKLQLWDNAGNQLSVPDVIVEAVRLLKAGKLLAVKGIGGFHLMCAAENQEAVAELRRRKNRPHRPLAVMAADTAAVERQCHLGPKEKALLEARQASIVLLQRKQDCSLPECIAPDSDKIGMLLPYSPLHKLLLGKGSGYLIATSGNISGQPMEYENLSAAQALGIAADYFLLHDRAIHIPVDDSVTKVYKEKETLSRLGRGYAPLVLHTGAKHTLAALGGEQKSSVSLSRDGYVHTSQYLGDIKSPKAYETYKHVLQNLMQLLKVQPEAYVHDMHPNYMSTQYALEQSAPSLGIQHHFAHMAGCIAEHKLKDPVIGVIYDGTGYGLDSKVWGGELLVGSLEGFRRAGHLKYCKIQGMDKAIEEPWRTGFSYLNHMNCIEQELFQDMEERQLRLVGDAWKAGFHCFESSSMGRLFDCAAALLGLCSTITYDAQAAIRLEHIADKTERSCYEHSIKDLGECLQLNFEDLLRGVISDIKKGISKAQISGRFHNTIGELTNTAVKWISHAHGIKQVVLSGGCFENLYLMDLLVTKLEKSGFMVFYNEKLPCNDGGLSFGQMAAADRMLGGD